MQTELLSRTQVQQQYGLSRDTAGQLCAHLPYITIGHKGVGAQVRVLRRHVDALLEHVAAEQGDLPAFLRRATVDEVRALVIRREG